MSIISASVFSKVLQTSVGVNIITPYSSLSDKSKGEPCVLYLLHGLFGSQYAWLTASNIVRYAKEHNIVIVMPDLNNTFYVNSSANIKYLDFAAYELVEYIESTFRVSAAREDNFVCGLSMGGYGAYRIAFERPEKFSVAVSLSGALDVAAMSAENIDKMQEMFDETIVNTLKLDFGERGVGKNTENDLLYLAQKINSKKIKPALLQYCGKQDYLYEYNLNFKNHIESLDFEYKYFESDGFHDWDFWDDKIKHVLEELKKINKKI